MGDEKSLIIGGTAYERMTFERGQYFRFRAKEIKRCIRLFLEEEEEAQELLRRIVVENEEKIRKRLKQLEKKLNRISRTRA